jgi:branched-chain amino acid transport system substrate-binding protein
MKTTLRTIAFVLVTLIAAACTGRGGTETARARLEAVPRGGSPPTDHVDGGEALTGTTETPTGAPEGPAQPSGNPVVTPRLKPASGEVRRAASTATGTVSDGAAVASASPGQEPRPAGDRGSSGVAAGGARLAAPGADNRSGVTDNEVVFGMHLPQSGPVGFLLGKSWHGADAYLRSVNDAGGVHGRKIRFVVADDGYSAQKAAGAIRDLVDTKKVFAASCFAGIDQCVVGLEYANAKGVPYIHAGMRESIVEQSPWAFPVTGSYPYLSERLVDYLFTQRAYTKERKIAALHLNSANFDEAYERFQRRLAHYGAKVAVRYPVEKDQSDFSAGITKMQNAGIDTVWYFVDPTLIAKFASQAKLLRFQPQYVFVLAGGDLYSQATGGNLDGAYGLSPVADPHWNGAGMARFKDTFERYYPDEEPSEFHALAYVEAEAFVEGLRRAGPDLGRDAFVRGMAAIDLFDSGISSPMSSTRRSRAAAAHSTLAVWKIHGTRTDQVGGFDF